MPGRVGDRPAGGWLLAVVSPCPAAPGAVPGSDTVRWEVGGRGRSVGGPGQPLRLPSAPQTSARRKCSSWWSSFPQQGLGVTVPPALCLWDTQESAGTRGIAPTQRFCPVRCHSWHRAPCPGRPRAITRGHPWIKMLLCGGRSAALVSHHLRFETSTGRSQEMGKHGGTGSPTPRIHPLQPGRGALQLLGRMELGRCHPERCVRRGMSLQGCSGLSLPLAALCLQVGAGSSLASPRSQPVTMGKSCSGLQPAASSECRDEMKR